MVVQLVVYSVLNVDPVVNIDVVVYHDPAVFVVISTIPVSVKVFPLLVVVIVVVYSVGCAPGMSGKDLQTRHWLGSPGFGTGPLY